MSKSVQSILKKIDRGAVRDLVDAYAPELLDKIDWSDEHDFGRSFETLIDGAGDAGGKIRDALIFAERFLDDCGRSALRSIAAMSTELLETFDAAPDSGAAAIELLLSDADAFYKALAAYEADRLVEGQSWGGFLIANGASARLNDETKRRFEATIREKIVAAHGGGHSKVEWFSRRVRDPLTGADDRVEQATIYFEHAREARLRFTDASNIKRFVDRGVNEGAVLWNRTQKTVEVTIKGGKERKNALAEAFANSVFEGRAELKSMPRRELTLNRLKNSSTACVATKDHVEKVRVVSLVLSDSDEDGGLVVIKRQGRGDRGDVYGSIPRWFGDHDPLTRPGVRVIATVIRFFRPSEGSRRARPFTVTLTAPNKTNLATLSDADRAIAEMLLMRWGILAPRSDHDEDVVVEVDES